MSSPRRRMHELIDTLWNVNSENQLNAVNTLTELIDTLWNVNDKQIKEIGDIA